MVVLFNVFGKSAPAIPKIKRLPLMPCDVEWKNKSSTNEIAVIPIPGINNFILSPFYLLLSTRKLAQRSSLIDQRPAAKVPSFKKYILRSKSHMYGNPHILRTYTTITMNINTKYLLAALIGALSLECLVPTAIGIAAYAQQSQTPNTQGHFVANLSGKNLFPPVNTNSSGQAVLNVTSQGSKMGYVVKANGLDKVTSVSLEYTLGGRSRDIILLYNGVKSGPTGKINGLLTQGSFAASDFLSDFAGKHISDLIKAMTDGNIFLRVRTISLPLGEIGGKVTPNLS